MSDTRCKGCNWEGGFHAQSCYVEQIAKLNLQVEELQKKLDRVIEITQERVDVFTETWNVTHGVGADGRLDAATKLLTQFKTLIEKRKDKIGPCDCSPADILCISCNGPLDPVECKKCGARWDAPCVHE